jgi:hypothetical protein
VIVGFVLGVAVGASLVGISEGIAVLGVAVGAVMGASVGVAVLGIAVGLVEGISVGGANVGFAVGLAEGISVGVAVAPHPGAFRFWSHFWQPLYHAPLMTQPNPASQISQPL